MEQERGTGSNVKVSGDAMKIIVDNIDALKLSDADKIAITQANRAYVWRAGGGLLIGGNLGIAFPYRQRSSLYREVFGLARAVSPVPTATVIRGYRSPGEIARNVTPPRIAAFASVWRFAQAIGLGWLGATVGVKIGNYRGRIASCQVMDLEGARVKERIQATLDKTARELQQLRDVHGPKNVPEATRVVIGGVVYTGKLDSPGGLAVGEFMNSRIYDADEIVMNSGSRPPEPLPWNLAGGLGEIGTRPASSLSRGIKRGDFEEMRASTEPDEVETEKEKRRREFEELLDREREGGRR